jgi:hypothetical protein
MTTFFEIEIEDFYVTGSFGYKRDDEAIPRPRFEDVQMRRWYKRECAYFPVPQYIVEREMEHLRPKLVAALAERDAAEFEAW